MANNNSKEIRSNETLVFALLTEEGRRPLQELKRDHKFTSKTALAMLKHARDLDRKDQPVRLSNLLQASGQKNTGSCLRGFWNLVGLDLLDIVGISRAAVTVRNYIKEHRVAEAEEVAA